MKDALIAGVERLEAAALFRRSDLFQARALSLGRRRRRHLERAKELEEMGLPVFRDWLVDRAEELAGIRRRLEREAIVMRRRARAFHVEPEG